MGLPVLKALINSTQIAGDHLSSLNIFVLTSHYGLTGAIEGADPQLSQIAGTSVCTLFILVNFINVCLHCSVCSFAPHVLSCLIKTC